MTRSELENKIPCLAFSRPLAQGQFSALQASEAMLSAATSLADFVFTSNQKK